MRFFNAGKCFLPSKEQKIHKANNTTDDDKILCLFSVTLPSNIRMYVVEAYSIINR